VQRGIDQIREKEWIITISMETLNVSVLTRTGEKKKGCVKHIRKEWAKSGKKKGRTATARARGTGSAEMKHTRNKRSELPTEITTKAN